jgi:hypothetical protein
MRDSDSGEDVTVGLCVVKPCALNEVLRTLITLHLKTDGYILSNGFKYC